MGAGLYGLNGINPTTSKKLIEVYVIPRLIYGLECLPVSTKDIQPMEVYYRELLQHIQHLPKSTANQACYLLIGAIPIEAHVHIKTLTLFGAIMRMKDSVEYQIIDLEHNIRKSSIP